MSKKDFPCTFVVLGWWKRRRFEWKMDPIMNEFQDVCPDEISGMSLKRDVKFTIN